MDDLIRRQNAVNEVVAWLKDRMSDKKNGKPLTDRINDLPSAQPETEELDFVQPHKKICVKLEIGQPKRSKGEWVVSHIPDSMLWKCNQCGFDCGAHSFNFCPNRGSYMGEKKNV